MTRMQTHGDLPCPACGHLRRGLDHAKACPECGARGFHGDLVVSGEPEVHKESRRAGRVAHVARSTASVLLVLSAPGWIVTRGSVWSDWSSIGVIVLFGIALAIWIHGRIRRRNEVAAGGTLERVVWDFEADGVRVREFSAERFVPYGDIKKAWSLTNFVVSRKTRVQLEIRGESLRADGMPTIMLCGSSAVQRTAVDAIKQRVAAAHAAS